MENIELMMSMCGVWLQLKILVPKNEDLAKTKSQMALQNALLVHQSARPLPFSINNILHQVRTAF